ncbi:gephyrin-like molybdotransferase Glp [Paracoccus sp. (in: a-proteobacteria)]|uniref:molybdopterin molybdotransferase MoeA n=1 Tax=Paracoccus sp. TaxID=267 RepID=UPI0028978229|nr:gephyrin-like molybdotransferase Glp [Paracoccus sp. (in: a-proteobacteria)]
MISVDEATRLVLALARPPQSEEIAIEDALHRVMIAPAVAQMTQPPFDAAAMDGYALRGADLPGPLRVIGTAAAGAPWSGSAQPGTAIRIFTGAPVPAGYDRVVMQEIVSREQDEITVTATTTNPNIRAKGNDFAQGFHFQPPRPLAPSDLALLAAMNVAKVTVARRPIVAVLAGGDELVRPGTQPGPGQIICSNDIAIAGLAREAGAEVRILPIARDTEESLRSGFDAARGADLLVTIGGASVGDHDLVAKVAADMGLERSFYKLAMRPGKPLMAGRIGQSAMLGLPGNPVSSIVCAILFLQPLLAAMQGLDLPRKILRARLGAELSREGNRMHFLRASLKPGLDLPEIVAFADQDSARLGILAQADALLIRPADDPARQVGEMVEYLPLRS